MRQVNKRKTPEEVRAEFTRRGITIRSWSRANGISERVVYELLRGRFRGRYGQAHRAAVLLGLKEGVVD
jgi:gp16 family phage-associated protein